MVSQKSPKLQRSLKVWQLLGIYAGVFVVALAVSVIISGQLFCFVHGGWLCETTGVLLGPILSFPLSILAIHRLLSGQWLPSSKEKPTIIALIISLLAFAGLFYLLTFT